MRNLNLKDKRLPPLIELIDAPEGLARLLDRLERVDQQRAAYNRGSVEVVHPATLISRGMNAEDARTAHEEARAAEAARAESHAAAADALAGTATAINKWLIGHADELIANAIQPKVDTILETAEPLAATLAPYGPDFAAATIARKATPDQLAAWQESRDLATRHRTLVQGWLAIWARVTARPSHGRPDKSHMPKVAGGVHVWRNPAAIADLRIRDGVHADVLNLAPHRANYRLVTPSEIKRYEDRYQLRRPIRDHATVKVWELTNA